MPVTIDFSGKTAPVTGGTRRIGRTRVAQAGAHVAILFRCAVHDPIHGITSYGSGKASFNRLPANSRRSEAGRHPYERSLPGSTVKEFVDYGKWSESRKASIEATTLRCFSRASCRGS